MRELFEDDEDFDEGEDPEVVDIEPYTGEPDYEAPVTNERGLQDTKDIAEVNPDA